MTISLIPLPWKIGAALAFVAVLGTAGAAYHHHVDQGGYDRAVAERAARDASAVFHRVQDNIADAAKNTGINRFLTKDHDEKLAPVVTRIVTERVRVGPAICGPAAPAQTGDAGGGDSANPPGRLVRSDIERDIIALKLAVENDLATGRTCQDWGRQHGFVE